MNRCSIFLTNISIISANVSACPATQYAKSSMRQKNQRPRSQALSSVRPSRAG